jgi:hypothetical protein
MPKHPVPFSLSALLKAPLVISVPAAVLLASGGKNPFVAFGICALISYVFTLAVVCCLLLAALWFVSRVASIKAWVPPVVGGFLASLIFLAWDYSNWCSSGVDSGPPATSYPQWIAKSWFTPEPLFVISFGVVTAAAYNFLATRRPNQSSQPPQSGG